jgi:hypothetical protein
VVILDIAGTAKPQPQYIRQSKDGTLILRARDASIHNPEHGQAARYESGNGKDNIGFWVDPQPWIDWSAYISKPGTYDVVAKVATTSQNARFTLRVGKQELTATTPSTGDWSVFEEIPVGQVVIEKTGPCRIEVRPIKEGWHPVNLQSIVLKPKDQ